MTRVVLITNFNAGRNRSRPDVIRRLTRDVGGECLQAEDLESIRRATREAVSSGAEVLAVNGGDGTVHGALTELMRTGCDVPHVAVIPGGTTNMTANDLNSNAPLEGCLRRVAEQVRLPAESRRLVNRPLLKVSGPAFPPQYGFFLGAGVILDGMEHFRSKVGARGFRGELASGISVLRGLTGMARGEGAWVAAHRTSFRDHASELRRDNQVLLVATTLERLLLGMRPWWGDGGGPIHLTSIRRRPKGILRRARALLAGRRHPRLTEEQGYFSQDIAGFDLFADGRFALDGEVFAVDDGQSVQVKATAPMSFLDLGVPGH